MVKDVVIKSTPMSRWWNNRMKRMKYVPLITCLIIGLFFMIIHWSFILLFGLIGYIGYRLMKKYYG